MFKPARRWLLCAVLQPIYWEHDHALYLYPLPDALVLADAAPAAAHVFDTCHCLNPVGWGSSGDGAAALGAAAPSRLSSPLTPLDTCHRLNWPGGQ